MWLAVMAGIGGLLMGGVLNQVAMRWDSRFGALGRSPAATKPRHYLSGQLAAPVVYVISAASLGLVAELVPLLFFVSILLVIVQTDLAERIIPDRIVLIGVVGLLLLRLWSQPLPYWNYILAALIGSGVLLVIGIVGERLLGKETMGGGDVKLYIVIGLMLGIKLTLLSLFVASLIGLLVTVVLRLAGRGAYGELVPFGPYIAVGAWCAYLWGEGWLHGYLAWVSRMFSVG
ncbi:prepilin peptidase [Paenibacillus daejeonensis]|uniref:prepilin peptidase n=1 Tax=Paenibacillus daejeonensis TaxID=135193 RepID=UPI0003723C71|nr:A24 family peptidase [Paenibacillus daejeonensis]